MLRVSYRIITTYVKSSETSRMGTSQRWHSAEASTRCSASNGMSVVEGSGRPTVSSDVANQWLAATVSSIRVSNYIYIYLHIYICTYVHIYIYTYMHIYTRTYIHMYIYIYILNIHSPLCLSSSVWCVWCFVKANQIWSLDFDNLYASKLFTIWEHFYGSLSGSTEDPHMDLQNTWRTNHLYIHILCNWF